MDTEEVKEEIKDMIGNINDDDLLLFVKAYLTALTKKFETNFA